MSEQNLVCLEKDGLLSISLVACITTLVTPYHSASTLPPEMQHLWHHQYVVPNLLMKMLFLYVTGYWKTDHNVTLGQLHFIGLANSHTHALSMH